ncbi:S9 family peptidase [Fodinibius saliphilus]|uniref:S9 family peptidase n=1 Tax=Fodinibius saliphilus TaxID=1920650 RepID=UPI001486C534|nr:prolyl oligopeptidase family serine peptidase [Fodinibius saliphilus]
MRLIKLSTFTLVLSLLTISSLFAQKQKLTPDDYDQWQSIRSTELSANGEWFGYNINLVDGDGWLTIKKVGTDSTGDHKYMHAERLEFSQDNQWAAFQIGVSENKKEKLEKQDKQVRLKLGLMNLSTTEVDTFKNISSYTFSDNGHYLAMKKYQAEQSKAEGTDLILRNLQEGTNQLIGNVSEYAFNDGSTKLAVLLDAHTTLGNGAHLYDLSTGRITVLDSDTTTYKSLEWSEDGTALAFLKEKEDSDFKNITHQILAFKNIHKSPEKNIFNHHNINNFPDEYRIVDYRNLKWSEDTKTLFFGIMEWEKKEKETKADSTKKDSGGDLDPSNVEVWHWKDDNIQAKQEVLVGQMKQENHLAAWHLDENTFVQIGNEMLEETFLTGNQQYAVGYNPKPYEPTFEEEWKDVYLVDVTSGESKKILEKHEYIRNSPDGKYLQYFKDQNWWVYNIEKGKHINLTKNINTRFQNFTNVNGRKNRRPFGRGEWAEDDRWFIVYDQYDAYKIWADGSKTEKLTSGTQDKIRYRQVRFDYDNKGIAKDETIYFSMYGDESKDRGYARTSKAGQTHTLVYEPKMYNRLTKADSTEHYIYQVQSATDSPDFFHVDYDFADPVALTYTNPQQDNYYWADDEVVTFTNANGEQLEGRLLYPANYDPDKKYPMITYIYEERSQTTHQYSIPTKRNPYNFRRFSSEGYFVFQPDITYELSNPGISAVESVVPAVEKMIDTGMVNKDQIGLTGHSWGAYQTTFIITQTNLFNSAVAGAPLTNMISMYNSVYWNSGTPDANIFEVSQGRFPDPWWKDWDNFVENSPIFQMEGVSTPLLVEFGTQDGAVDFNQGVELYNTMRRMQNPFVMLVYEGENHGLAREENQIDYANRAFQWHEHYLLGKEAPEWITDGLPYLQRPAMKDNGAK